MSGTEGNVDREEGAALHALPPQKAVFVILLLFPIIGAYFLMSAALGLAATYAGFVFLLYWAGFRGGGNAELAPALVGMTAAIGTCWMLFVLPAMMGPAGYALPLMLILISVFCLICGWLAIVFNQGFMLMLTVGGIAPLAATNPYADMAACVVLAAAYFGGLKLAYDVYASRHTVPAG